MNPRPRPVAGRTIVLVMFAAWLLAGCAWPFGLQPNPSPAGPGASAQQAGAWTESAAYRFTFRSTCGERTLVATFEVTVDDGSVNAYRALDGGR